MKNINLPALSQVNLEEVTGFLSWLNNQLAGEVSLTQIQRTPPIRSSKLNPAIKTLEQFGFITQRQGRIAIHVRGKDFLRSPDSVRKAVLRTLFTQVDWVLKVATALSASPTGRIYRGVINDSFASTSRAPIAESDILAFISWAESCELLVYGRKSEELVRVEPMVPRDPRPVAPNLPLAS